MALTNYGIALTAAAEVIKNRDTEITALKSQVAALQAVATSPEDSAALSAINTNPDVTAASAALTAATSPPR